VTQRLDTQTVVDGRYKVLNRIGSGGMADVYCAEDLQLGRNVALKVLHPRFAEDEEFVERFRREASSAAGLQHQHVVSVYDRGEWDGTYYIAMEYMHGRSLKNIIQEESPLEPARAIDLTMQVLRAARFAHRRGVIHRDLKPHNVIVDDSGTSPHAKVTDFGIARAGASDMTETGSIMGTAQYLSPEQAQGHAVSATSDLYSVGIVLYELLTGRVPFEGESAVTIALKQVNEHAVPPSAFNPAVTPELEAVVMRALEKDPARRFPDAQAFMDALDHARQTLGEEATTVVAQPTALEPVVPVAPVNGAAPPAEPPVAEEVEAERRRWAWWLIALLVVVAAIIAAALLLRGTGSDAPPRVTVPDVVGTDLASAQVRLRRDGLRVDTFRRNAPRKKGTVIGQNPPATERVPKGSTVTLTVSEGPGTATVPTVQGLTPDKARARLRKRGFKARTRTEPSDSITAGLAVRTSPPAGATVRKGKRVTLLLSSGPVQVTVPGAQGQSFSEASLALQNAGFRVARSDRQTSSADPETVIGQSPSAGTSVDKGSTVTLTVATAPPAPPQPPPPPKVAVPDIAGETQDVAVRRLSSEGFAVNIKHQDVDSPEGDGVVIAQSPSGGTARKGSTVTITVGTFNPSLVPDTGGGGTGGTGGGDDGTGGSGSGDGTSGASGGGAPAPGSGTAIAPATPPPTP
jgi:eukaryotic-like serine/threonine-protein kinase